MSHQSDLPPRVPSCVSTGAGVTVPDATATPRTDAIEHELHHTFSGAYMRKCIDGGWCEADFARTLERELAAAIAALAQSESARRDEESWRKETHDYKARAERAEAQLRERTQWQCKCGGTDCAGMAENERLRAEVERFTAGGLLNAHAICDQRDNAVSERDQLRARVADLENDLEKSKHEADDWHRAWETVTEQAKKEVTELEQDKARLDWLEKSFNDDPIAKVPTWFSVFCDVAQEGPHPAPGQSLRAAIDAARAGKGAT